MVSLNSDLDPLPHVPAAWWHLHVRQVVHPLPKGLLHRVAIMQALQSTIHEDDARSHGSSGIQRRYQKDQRPLPKMSCEADWNTFRLLIGSVFRFWR